ncbi:hypothetical protein RAZWK3B_01050 [Roseobacter sp. AzwK-3b]|uniref:hypothetical protein n=1 Tax=Roseobacter sp. AzwK-3b TaxID=351016 RepID=UPI0001569912|nr:hypothetical protein [Roseobacter sp. AzwK-3b]EDM72764.1 hypothetical protein RAZWK3B_01050 [Roseobacter sp. AzwK-3b]
MLRLIGRLVVFVLVAGVLAGSAIYVMVLDDRPLIAESSAPKPQDVVVARSFVHSIRSAAGNGATPTEPLVMSDTELNSLLRLGARFVPGFRSDLRIAGDSAVLRASIPVPYTPAVKFLNISARIPEFEGQVMPTDIRVGPVPIPPGLALEIARVGANTAIGNGVGDTVLGAVTRMTIDDQNLSFDLAMDDMGKNGIMRGLFGTMRGADMPMASQIDRYYLMIREAMERGDLPATGSYLPYLHFTLQAALDGSTPETLPNAYTAAMFALTRVCGARDFPLIVGRLIGGDLVADRDWRSDCDEVTLNGRIDSRRHFTTAAALQAASNRGFAVSVGEFKELYDTLQSGGFDFTDLAANNSGIRMSNRLMTAPPQDWPALLARLQSENDVIVPFDDIPQIMSQAEFDSRYGSVDSAEYAAVLDAIEARIDTLALHAARD